MSGIRVAPRASNVPEVKPKVSLRTLRCEMVLLLLRVCHQTSTTTR